MPLAAATGARVRSRRRALPAVHGSSRGVKSKMLPTRNIAKKKYINAVGVAIAKEPEGLEQAQGSSAGGSAGGEKTDSGVSVTLTADA